MNTWIKTGRLYIRADDIKQIYYRPTKDRNGRDGFEFFAVTDRKKPRLGFFRLKSERQAKKAIELLIKSLVHGGIVDFDQIVESAKIRVEVRE
ncbi:MULTISPECIES: hypothetical protein [unclassified Archaeoglobus]|mgnify:CR=1 FL=1|jgi:hypothetical protein|uniref:hypothetical protein n=1 Tax=unclassified Archaeoglobus TaxID=2643606 RepID=UPI0025C71EEA|nr:MULTISPECIES: hypothetical protein [unclassified Archaeoglobus]